MSFEDQSAPVQEVTVAKGPITINLSHSLLRKLDSTAKGEGIPMEELISELLAESVVLRAWEILESKQAMRGQIPSQQGQGNHQNRQQRPSFRNQNNNNGQQRRPGHSGHQQGKRQGNPNAAGNHTILEDSASFLEYVRNQEKRRR